MLKSFRCAPFLLGFDVPSTLAHRFMVSTYWCHVLCVKKKRGRLHVRSLSWALTLYQLTLSCKIRKKEKAAETSCYNIFFQSGEFQILIYEVITQRKSLKISCEQEAPASAKKLLYVCAATSTSVSKMNRKDRKGRSKLHRQKKKSHFLRCEWRRVKMAKVRKLKTNISQEKGHLLFCKVPFFFHTREGEPVDTGCWGHSNSLIVY